MEYFFIREEPYCSKNGLVFSDAKQMYFINL